MILRWAFWTIAIALLAGGKAWNFPAGGALLREQFAQTRRETYGLRSRSATSREAPAGAISESSSLPPR